MARVLLSTVVVAHDSLAELRHSLRALAAELSPGDELIVVDNASRDGLEAELEALAPEARLVSLERNVGFAAGANRGAEVAHGDLLVLLNTVLAEDGYAGDTPANWGIETIPWRGGRAKPLVGRGAFPSWDD